MDFQFRHHNRLVYPQKHIMVVEDIIGNQKRIMDHFHQIFDSDGIVQVSIVPGAIHAASMIQSSKIDLIILDHDLPNGNGSDLLNWMKKHNHNIPIITFSGIPYNNQHMVNLGATHLFGKEDVINGKSDEIIKFVLGLSSSITIEVSNEDEKTGKIAEYYINTVSPNSPTLPRYWITDNILIGGNIIDQTDWEHLQKDFGIKGVINVDPRPDSDKGIDQLLECGVNDDGNGFPKEKILQACEFATKIVGPIYLHCHLGFSRSPHFAYAILRQNYKLTKEEALSKVKSAIPSPQHLWGFNQHTESYMRSIEEALND